MKVVAFDLFGTVFDLSVVDRQEIRDYASHIRKSEWSPLELPQSWETWPAHPDSAEGIERLRKKFFVVTLSNAPLGMAARLSKHNGISWDAIIPLELKRVYKPDLEAYLTVNWVLGVSPKDTMMVTANKDFGDLEGSEQIGMTPQLIRHPGEPQTIIELARKLGC